MGSLQRPQEKFHQPLDIYFGYCLNRGMKHGATKMNTQAIAQHLNLAEELILEVRVWARVLWVRIKGMRPRFVSKKVTIMSQPMYIELDTYRKKGINAYLVKEGLGYEHNMYGEPLPRQEDAAHKGKKHTVRVRIDNLADGKYKYKEAGGADFNKSRYGWIQLKNGEIVDQG